MDRCRNGPGFHNDIDGNSTIQEILIPASKVGLVIGKGGETIKQLQVREPLAEQRSTALILLHLPGLEGSVRLWRVRAGLAVHHGAELPLKPLPECLCGSERFLWPGSMPAVTPRPGVPVNWQQPLWR